MTKSGIDTRCRLLCWTLSFFQPQMWYVNMVWSMHCLLFLLFLFYLKQTWSNQVLTTTYQRYF